jgi:hypothetical protein
MRYLSQSTLKNRFWGTYTKLLTRYNIGCKLCIIHSMKMYRLFRYYIPTEYLQQYLPKRKEYDNYIMNIAVVGDYFLVNKLNITDEFIRFNYLYLNIFDVPFHPERARGMLRQNLIDYETGNKYLLAVPIAVNYCQKLRTTCYEKVLDEIDLSILDELYQVDSYKNKYYLK